MKIAVLLYGHLRDFEVCADSLNENLLSRYDCDVFMHTWDERDHNSKCWHEQRFDAAYVGEDTINIIKSKYNPKGLLVEHQEKYKDEKIIQSLSSEDFKMSTAIPHFIFYGMNKANQMRIEYEKNNGVKYDYVIVTRPDVRLKTPFVMEKYLSTIEVLGFDMNACRFYGAFNSNFFNELGHTITNQANDLFFFAKPNVIDKYIEVNKVLASEEIEKYAINFVSIYTAKEIHNGIMPIPLVYMMDEDWDFSGVRVEATPKREIKTWKKALFGFVAVLLYPIFRLQKKYQIINYYEFKKC